MAIKIGNGLDLLNQRIQNLGDGSAPTDAVTLQQLQAYVRGLDWKPSVRVATTANITLTGTQTIDGVTLVAGNEVLVKNQTTGADNGIYVVASGAWTRRNDADASVEVTAGLAVSIAEGTVNGNTTYILTLDDPITLGTTALVFSQLGGGGTVYTAGNGLQLSSGAFSILLDTGSGLISSGTGLKIDPTYTGLAKRFATNVGTTTPATITHNLGTLDVVVQVIEVSTGSEVDTDVQRSGINTVQITFATAPTAGQYRAVIVG